MCDAVTVDIRNHRSNAGRKLQLVNGYGQPQHIAAGPKSKQLVLASADNPLVEIVENDRCRRAARCQLTNDCCVGFGPFLQLGKASGGMVCRDKNDQTGAAIERARQFR